MRKVSYELYISNFDWQFLAGFFIIDDLNKGPSIYYTNTFSDIFGPTHYYISINKILNVSKYGHFLNPSAHPPCPYADVIYEWSLRNFT
jgi:hypothetical protein